MRYPLQIPQLLILLFLGLWLFLAWRLGVPLAGILADALVRLPMNGVLVLSLVPMLNAGLGVNYGLPVGVSAGLLGLCLAVEWNLSGLTGLAGALLFSLVPALCFGYGYAWILRRVKGQEEITALFVGFAFVPIMNFFWAVAPFQNPAMLWPIGGYGLRPTIGLKSTLAKTLNQTLAVPLAGFTVPTGLILFFLLLCGLTALLFRTRTGRALIALGADEKVAILHGLDIQGLRTLAVLLSTVLAGFGIVVYAQSYGFIELYDAPLMMAFPAASAVLVGGSVGHATRVIHVILGTFLFQTTYLISGPIANELFLPELAEIFRMMITNGVILAALLMGRRSHA